MSEVYDAIKEHPDLPSPKGVALQILELVDREDVTAAEIGKVIGTDPALSGRLLKLVNSAFMGLGRSVGSVTYAVALLGLATVKNLSLGFSLLAENKQGRCEAFDYERFWPFCLGVAVSNHGLAARLGGFMPDEAFTFGLLSRIGELGLASVFPERYGQLLAVADREDPVEVLDLEREIFQIDHFELASAMMEDWKLPPLFCTAAGYQGRIHEVPTDESRMCRLSYVLQLSSTLAQILVDERVEHESLARAMQIAARLGLEPVPLSEHFDAVREQWRQMGAIYDIKTRNVLSLSEIYSRARDRRIEENAANQTHPTAPIR